MGDILHLLGPSYGLYPLQGNKMDETELWPGKY